MTVERTRVAIVGGGPAGLLLSHLLHLDAVEHVVLETRSRTEIENTHRAGILEAGSVSVLAEAGLDRVLRDGDRHDGVVLRFDGENHRVDFADLTGRAVWSYPQTEIFKDLASRREVDGGDVRYPPTVTNVMGVHTERPTVNWTGVDGRSSELRCDVLVGADGSHSTLRHSLPESVRRTYVHEYPYAWFRVIVEAPRSAPELVYTASVHGFSMVSQRTPTHRRLYFQCDPDEDPTSWDDERIWAELQRRVAGPDGFRLVEGPVEECSILRFRSAVVEPARHGRMLLAGDAAYTVPPTGAKGLNLALADVVVLYDVLTAWLVKGDDDVLDEYGRRLSERVWRTQHFSAWMSRMLHSYPGESGFGARRRVAEVRMLAVSEAGRRFLAEGYTGWARSFKGASTMTTSPPVEQPNVQVTDAPDRSALDAAAESQETISAEIRAIHDDYESGRHAGAAEEAGPRLDFPPYRSSLLRHPTKDIRHADPETIELFAPVFGERDIGPQEADLTIQHGGEPIGERIVVAGRVLDGDGRPVPRQLVEVWQANAAGRYVHKRDQHPAPIDPNFTGVGRMLTDDDGWYRFTTIKPGPYPWKNHFNAWRPEHIHFSLFGTEFTQRVVTQMYFPGDPLFGLDPIYQSIPDQSARDRLVAAYDHAVTSHEWATGYRWDIVLTGSQRTWTEPEGADA